jgi:type IV secretory pathway TraG/TraD family ATPase VirD4
MIRYTAHPQHPEDGTLWHEWQGLLTGNKEGIKSFILSALTALRALSNDNVARLTASSSFKLADIRRRRTVIYFITPAQHAEYYAFLTSIFFQSVFNMAMRQMPESRDLPIYVLYDEFGHSTIPNFVSIANTIRGYKVSLSIVLQAISQLNLRYGRDYAEAIQGGFNTWLTFSGSDPETALFFETIIGRVRERTRKSWDDVEEKYTEYNLLNANEVRTIGSHQALMVSANRNPVLLDVLPHYANPRLAAAIRRGAFPVPAQPGNDALARVPLAF